MSVLAFHKYYITSLTPVFHKLYLDFRRVRLLCFGSNTIGNLLLGQLRTLKLPFVMFRFEDCIVLTRVPGGTDRLRYKFQQDVCYERPTWVLNHSILPSVLYYPRQ